MTANELKSLLHSDRAEEVEQAVEYLVTSLTSGDEKIRRHGYELLEDGFKEALYRSCLNYGSLAGGFTQPLMTVVMRTVEFWATQSNAASLRSGSGMEIAVR